jgi:hypothetical protein
MPGSPDVRHAFLAGPVLIAVLAGCAEVSDEPPTFTAMEALEEAEKVRPGRDLFSLRGLEGWRPGPRSDYLGLTDDGLADGPLGDGRLSSWVASFVQEEGLLEVQVFADGRDPVIRHHEVPYVALDELVFVERGPDVVDSDVAAAVAGQESGFAGHVAAAPGAGFLYTHARNDLRYAYDVGEQNERLDFVGWPVINNSWAVVHFPTEGAEPMALASVAADGTSLGVRADRALHVVPLADEEKVLVEPFPPPMEPVVHRFEFAVPRGATNLTGNIGVPSLFEGEYHLRVLAADGQVVFDSAEESTTYAELDAADPAIGNWTVEATHLVPMPQPPSPGGISLRRVLDVYVAAELPVLAGT